MGCQNFRGCQSFDGSDMNNILQLKLNYHQHPPNNFQHSIICSRRNIYLCTNIYVPVKPGHDHPCVCVVTVVTGVGARVLYSDCCQLSGGCLHGYTQGWPRHSHDTSHLHHPYRVIRSSIRHSVSVLAKMIGPTK